MTTSFKPGDRVVAVDRTGKSGKFLAAGRVYTIARIWPTDVLSLEETVGTFSSHRFLLAEEEPLTGWRLEQLSPPLLTADDPDGTINFTVPKAVYIAGPMRGIAEFNFPAFDAAGTHLHDLHVNLVFSPADRDREVANFHPHGLTGNEDLNTLGFSLRDALAADLDWITTRAEGIYLLKGWRGSSGARAELATAAALGLVAMEQEREGDGWVPAVSLVSEPTSAPFVSAGGEVRVTSATGGQKGSKPERFDLIPAGPLRTLARLYGKGAEKYADRNWERGYDWSLSFAALNRHLWLFWSGQDDDDETGLPHMASVAWHAFALLEFASAHPEFDNRPILEES